MQVADHRDAEVLVDAQQRIHDDAGVARIERGDRLVGEDDVAAPAPARGRSPRAAAGRRRADRRAAPRSRPCRTARAPTWRSALSSSGQSWSSERQVGTVGKPAHQHVGQHVEPADQVELLEDHGRARAPLRAAPRPAAPSRRRPRTGSGPALGSTRRLIMRSSVDLPAPERPITPIKLPRGTENDALSTAVLLPNRQVSSSTTSIPSPRACPMLGQRLTRESYSYVTAGACSAHQGCRQQPFCRRHPNVIDLSFLVPKKLAPQDQDSIRVMSKTLSATPLIHPIGLGAGQPPRRLQRGRRAHDPHRSDDGRLLLRRERQPDHLHVDRTDSARSRR